MSEEHEIDKNINRNNENKNVDDCAEPESIETIAIVNTVLAYIHYGISSATPDNVIEVVLGHFTGEEILDAKIKLWKECELGDPPTRQNSRARKASAAHLSDILDKLYKVDTDCYAFLVESVGIARLPRFNAEYLNVVSIDKRIAELKQECFALKVESSSYRHDYLKCMDQLDVMKTVLQQHTNALHDLTGPTSTSNTHENGTIVEFTHTSVPGSPSAKSSTDDSPCLSDVTSQSSPMPGPASDTKSDTSNQSMITTSFSQLIAPVSLQSQLSVSSQAQHPSQSSSALTCMTSSTETARAMSGSGISVLSASDCQSKAETTGAKYQFSQPLFMHQPIPSGFVPTFTSTAASHQVNGTHLNQHTSQHGLPYRGAPHYHYGTANCNQNNPSRSGAPLNQHGPLQYGELRSQCDLQHSGVSAKLHDPPHNGTCYGPNVPPAGSVSSVTPKHNSSRGNQRRPRRVLRRITDPDQSEFCMFDDNNGFERTKHDIKRENRREIQRRNVIYGTRKNTRLIPTKTDTKHSNCDLSIHHLPRKTTVGGVKAFLSENNINIRHVRLDIVSHQLATYESFRLIAPEHYRNQLLSPEFWPVNVRVSRVHVTTVHE